TYQVDFTNTGPELNDFSSLVTGVFTSTGALLALSSAYFSPPKPGTAFHIIDDGAQSNGAFSNLPNENDSIELVAGTGERHTFTIKYAGEGVDLIYQNTATQV